MPRHRVPMTTLGTDQSQFNEAPFQKLHNLAIREAGMVEPLPGRATVVTNYAGSGEEGRRIWPLKDQPTAYEIALVRATSSPTYDPRVIAEASASYPVIASQTLFGEPCGLTEARQRPIYAGPRGVLVFEEDAGTTRMLGMLPPTWIGISGKTTTDAQAVPASSRVAWRATLHRTAEDDYEISSAPSYAMYGESTASITDFTIRVGWPTSAAVSDVRVLAGDTVRLWRSRSVTASTSTNDRYLLTAEVVLSSTDITNRYVDIRDVTPDAALASAEELYTNPGIQGALQANWQLGPCGDVAVYNGHAFYAERSLPAYFEARIASRFGALNGGAAVRRYGIGRRALQGDATLGSPTLTGVAAIDLVGLAIGQVVTSGGSTAEFALGVAIVSFDAGLGTVTFDTNAIATLSSTTITVTDVVAINGDTLRANNLATLAYDAWNSNARVIFTFSQVFSGEGLSTSFVPAGTATDDGLSIRIDMIAPEGVDSTDLEITATNGANYSLSIPELDDADPATGKIDERLNRVKWSKLDQPEHVPAVNELVVGKDEIIRLLSTGDRLLVFCSDGTYAITGNESAWSVDRVDKDLIIASQAAADEMSGDAYVYANDRGLLRIGSDGSITGLSKGAVQRAMNEKIAAEIASDGNGLYEAHVVCDELHSEVGVFFNYVSNYE